MREKETAKIVITGHVDHGKSTLIGRLLLATKSLPKEKLAEIERISKELGKDTELAFAIDQLEEERSRSITIDTAQIFFKTPKRSYCIIDAPGHVEFLKNMITGATLAQGGLLVVDVEEGIKEQTTRHAYILSMLGIDKLIVVFNKMDLVGNKQETFEKVRRDALAVLEELGIEPTYTIPVSAKQGTNFSGPSSEMSWYKGACVLDALDSLDLTRETVVRPLRLPVQDVYQVDGEEIIVGRISSGNASTGQNVVLLPSGRKARIDSLREFGKELTEAGAEQSIGLTLDPALSVERGEVIAEKESQPQPTDRFKGNIFWMAETPLEVNNPNTLRCATQETEVIAERIEKRINSSTLEVIEEDAPQLKLNEAGVVVFKTDKPIVAEKFSFVEELGRFVIEHEYNVQGAGIIVEGR